MWGPILAWVRKQIGQRTDTASATGSVHAKLSRLLEKCVYASNSVLISADTENTFVGGGSYVLNKEIIVTLPGRIRVNFDIKTVGIYSGRTYGKVYKNGVAVGTERFNSTGTYATFTEDFTVAAGDKIQLYCYESNTLHTGYARNFRVCGTLVSDIGIATLD